MTALVAAVDAEYARQLTDRIKVAVEGTWHLITEAYQSRAWSVMGYASWDDYCTREFGTARLKLPREDRISTVQSLKSAGLSLRAIESATGTSKKTIIADLRQVVESTPPAVEVPAGVVDAETGEFFEEDEPLNKVATAFESAEKATTEPTVTIGIDGKKYKQPPAKRAVPRKPLSESAHVAGLALREAMEKVERLFDDDRYRQNAEQVAAALRSHLQYVAETVSAVLDQLP